VAFAIPAMIASTQMPGRWFGVAFRSIHDAHAVFEGQKLRPFRLNVDFRAAQTGQDERCDR
jgi:hypothetical protein